MFIAKWSPESLAFEAGKAKKEPDRKYLLDDRNNDHHRLPRRRRLLAERRLRELGCAEYPVTPTMPGVRGVKDEMR